MTREKDFGSLDQYPKLIAGASANEKCKPCILCEPVCPTKAISVSFEKTREDFGPLRSGIVGKIDIDREKCNLCGRCARFCKAFLLIDKTDREKDPKNLNPYDQLLLDEELCDFCTLCVSICPEEAIKVEGQSLPGIEKEKFELKGSIKIDPLLCIGCGRCQVVCPYDAIEVMKPFLGEINLIEKNLVRCDPLGCQACFNVCPAKCWFVDERGKAKPVTDQCIYCGACEKACPVSAIRVTRSGVNHTEIKETPWAEEWKEAISTIKRGSRNIPDVSGAIKPPDINRPPMPEPERPKVDPDLQKLVYDALMPLIPLLEKPKVRAIIEREPSEKASSLVIERLRAQKAKSKEKAGSE